MRKGTSGLLLTENADGSLRVEYVDYGVGFFGGGDGFFDKNFGRTRRDTESFGVDF